MSNNKKPRKTYRNKSIKGNLPVIIRLGENDERNLSLIPHIELDKLRNGWQNETHWNTITCRLNIGMTLSKLFNGNESTIMEMALCAMLDIQDRFIRVGKWGSTQDELQLAHDGLVLTDDMQKNTTRREHRDAVQYVFKNGALD